VISNTECDYYEAILEHNVADIKLHYVTLEPSFWWFRDESIILYSHKNGPTQRIDLSKELNRDNSFIDGIKEGTNNILLIRKLTFLKIK
jgi:hypothetical protein